MGKVKGAFYCWQWRGWSSMSKGINSINQLIHNQWLISIWCFSSDAGPFRRSRTLYTTVN